MRLQSKSGFVAGRREAAMAIVSMVHLRFRGDEEQALVLLHDTLAATRDRKGCRGVDVVQDREDPCHVVLVETWESPEDEVAYRQWRAAEPPDPNRGAFTAAPAQLVNFTLRDDV
jgi:heme oxygenase (mycobilin-producing)